MAWDIIPNTRVKCQAAVKKCNMKPEVAREVMRLWDHIQSNYPDVPDPLAFSADESGGKKQVKIMRIVQKKGYKKGAEGENNIKRSKIKALKFIGVMVVEKVEVKEIKVINLKIF